MAAFSTSVVPGLSLGAFGLGTSIHDVLSIVKADRNKYPAIDLHFSPSEPLNTPVIVTLPENGLRLRFDGADQRLRLLEVVNFSKCNLTYKGSDLVKAHGDGSAPPGPLFKRVYSLLGPSYPGEYMPPKSRSATGTYVLSWPGIAFNFPLQHAAWSPEKDHVSLLGSHVASPATHMALFEGKSWPEARRDLFVKEPTAPRTSIVGGRSRDSLPAEIELAMVLGKGKIELLRQPPAPSFTIVLNQTTPQDLVTELGPPDATHKREEPTTSEQRNRANSSSRPLSNGRTHPGSQPSSYSSTGTDTFDTDFDNRSMEEDPADRASRDKFWCYFSHGMDILIGLPSDSAATEKDTRQATPLSQSPHAVVLKAVIHGNVPGSYAFNRHRRLRWTVDIPPGSQQPAFSSEQHFDNDVRPLLLETFAEGRGNQEMGMGKVVNRTWGGTGPSDSSFFLLGDEQDLEEGSGESSGSEQWLGNTKLYSFPGLVFEVLENGCVSALTVC